jgi:hypothetical protein
MTARRFIFVLAALALAPLALAAAEKYTLKIEKPAQVGDTAKQTVTDNTEMKFTVRDGGGNVVQEKGEKKDTNAVYVETILAKKADKRAHKMSRKYESITQNKDGKKLDLDLVGKVVIIERKGMEHSFQYEGGGAVTGDTLDYLKEDFKNKDDEDRKMERAFMPKEAVAVGDSWKCDVADIAKSIGKDVADAVDIDKATATGKLIKVYPKGGATFGRIEINLTLPMSRIGPASANITADAGSAMVFKLTLDACIDGSRTEGVLSGGMDVKIGGSLNQNGQEFTLKVTGTGKMSHAQAPLK